MFFKKYERRIQYLEAEVEVLSERNEELQVELNEAVMKADNLQKALEMIIEDKKPLRDEKGRFVSKETIIEQFQSIN